MLLFRGRHDSQEANCKWRTLAEPSIRPVALQGYDKVSVCRDLTNVRPAHFDGHSVAAAVRDAGIGYVDDLNDPFCPAAAIGALDIIEDRCFHRASTYLAFLPPKLTQQRKSRLKICTNSIVMRLNFEQITDSVFGQRLIARGVHFEATNPRSAEFTYFAKAKKEIILCAGALGSPQILMLR